LAQADAHARVQEFQQAETLYNSVIADRPGSEEAFTARRKLVALDIVQDKVAEANAGLGAMMSEYAAHERLPHAVHEIAEAASKEGKGQSIRQVFQNALDSRSSGDSAIWLQFGVALSNVYMKNETAVAEGLARLVEKHGQDMRTAEAVGQLAWAYRKTGDPAAAMSLYRLVVKRWPDADRAIFSQRGIVLAHIELGELDEAEAEMDRLLGRFSAARYMPEVVSHIAEVYRGREEYPESRALHEYVVDHHPDSPQAIWSYRGIALAGIALLDKAGRDSAVNTLLTDFKMDPSLPMVLYQIARKTALDADSRLLYEYIIRNHPAHDMAALALANIACIHLRAADDKQAQAIQDQLPAILANRAILPKAVAVIADGHFQQALAAQRAGDRSDAADHFNKAIAVCDHVLGGLPETPHTTAEACYISAVCRERLGRLTDAVVRYRRTADQWPDFTYAADALNKVAFISESLLAQGRISREEAGACIRTASERVLRDYPDSLAARSASLRLSRYITTQ